MLVPDVYSATYRHVLYPAWEKVRRRSSVPLREQLARSQWAPFERQQEEQLRSLRRLLGHASQNVPFYASRFADAQLDPSSIRDLSDLKRIPLLSRDDVRTSFDSRRSTVPPFVAIHKTTSGSTGHPIRIAYDLGSEAWRQAVKFRSYAWAGYELGDRIIHYWGSPAGLRPQGKTRVKMTLDRMLRRELYIDCIDQSEQALERAVAEIVRFRPKVIVSYARAAANLASYIHAIGRRPWEEIPLIATAEQLVPEDRAIVERAFGKQIFDSYGGRETMLLAMECEAHDGLHVPMENILLELIVRDDAGGERPAEPGEVGEVVVTDLHNFGAPLIRYVNGDLARAAMGRNDTCRCGRTLPRIASIEGRSTDTMTDGLGNKVQGMFFPVLLLRYANAVQHYQAVQHLDRSVTFRFVPGPGIDAATASAIQGAIQDALKGVPVRLQSMPEIPAAPSGKRRPVVVERAPSPTET